ncbi:autotransporter outer membrane beta-barrel domain-containing protein [Pseudomonas marginalis]
MGQIITEANTISAPITGGAGTAGDAGSSDTGVIGANGGGGGGTGLVAQAAVINDSNIVGGNGGSGSPGPGANGGWSSSGGGGAGIVTGSNIINTGTVTGGDGGGGAPSGGGGGGGAAGIYVLGNSTLTTIMNTGVINGGNGAAGLVAGQSGRAGAGEGGGAGARRAAASEGASAIIGTNLLVQNSGTLNAGTGGDGASSAAITFNGGTNELLLSTGSVINGNVIGNGDDTLVLQNSLAGTGSGVAGGGSINGAQYQSFEHFVTNSGTWTVNNTLSATDASLNGGLLLLTTGTEFGGAAVTAQGGGLGAATNGITVNTDMTLSSNPDGSGGNGLTLSGTHAFSISGVLSGSGGLTKTDSSTVTLSGANTYTGGTTINAGTVALEGSGRLAASGAVTLANAGTTFDIGQAINDQTIGALSGVAGGTVRLGSRALTFGDASNQTYAGVVEGAGELVKQGAGTQTLTGASTYSGGTLLKQGRLNVGNSAALGTGGLSMDDGTTLGFAANNLELSNNITLTGLNDPVIDTGVFDATLSGVISGGGFITKEGAGVLTLTGANTYTGATDVAQGTLKAGAVNTFSAVSAHSVAGGATLDLAGFNQSVASLNNNGTVSLVGATPGTTLTVNGQYTGNDGTLRLGTLLNATGPSDRLILNGPTASASGHTNVEITNLGGLGALTTGDGIEVISARNGATTTAQTTKDAFSLLGGRVDAGAYEYRLFAGDAAGAGENWYLRSRSESGVISYRAEVPLYAALPNQLRSSNLAMLGDLRKRQGDDDVQGANTTSSGSDRRAWARVITSGVDGDQGGSASASSSGRLSGLQVGTDLLAVSNWRAGVYVGQLEGDVNVNGFVGGLDHQRAGTNSLRSQYVGAYGTYTADGGFYVDTVLQSGRHHYTAEPTSSHGVKGTGNSLLASIEVGQAFPLGGSGVSIEPQLQLIRQHLDLSDSTIPDAQVKPGADNNWITRAGVRVKGEINTGIGRVQPYARVNAYKTSNGTDVSRFINGNTTTDISAPTGGSSSELAAGVTLPLMASASLYFEVGKAWSLGGDVEEKSAFTGSIGLRMYW